MRQILVNLLDNAFRFTTTGRVVLEVRSEPAPPPPEEGGKHPRLLFEVEDSGPGIAKDLDHIFEPFAQAETEAMAEGVGLGLAISRGLAEMMGGRLTVESQVGKGSCFRLDVPVSLADGEAAQQGADTLRAPATAPEPPNSPALTPEALAVLPRELVRAMQEAVAEGDMARLAELIGRVKALDRAAARGLQALADAYAYEKLEKALGGIDYER